mmetsp:Transcript_58251/g.173171  ORF Transcript_58251/g.173171 Transcript_58251/m.173171 type:complete len:263 (+) Transcript_58251:532-1320(+)
MLSSSVSVWKPSPSEGSLHTMSRLRLRERGPSVSPLGVLRGASANALSGVDGTDAAGVEAAGVDGGVAGSAVGVSAPWAVRASGVNEAGRGCAPSSIAGADGDGGRAGDEAVSSGAAGSASASASSTFDSRQATRRIPIGATADGAGLAFGTGQSVGRKWFGTELSRTGSIFPDFMAGCVSKPRAQRFEELLALEFALDGTGDCIPEPMSIPGSRTAGEAGILPPAAALGATSTSLLPPAAMLAALWPVGTGSPLFGFASST